MSAARITALIAASLVWAALVVAAANRRFSGQGEDVSLGRLRRQVREEIAIFVAAVGLAVAASVRFKSGWVAGLIALFLVFCFVLALGDLRWRIIPNALVYPAYLLFGAAVLALWAAGVEVSAGVAGLGMLAFGGALLILALLAPHGMGMGDVKLAGLIGLVLGALGWSYVVVAATGAILAGGVGGVVVLVRGGRKTRIPFGPYLVMGALVSGFFAPRIAHWYLGRLV